MTTIAYATGLSQPSSFNYQRNTSNVTMWTEWVRQFNIYLKAGDEAFRKSSSAFIGKRLQFNITIFKHGKTMSFL